MLVTWYADISPVISQTVMRRRKSSAFMRVGEKLLL